MNCPSCPGALTARYVQGVEVDVCAACGGAWFDSGELEAYRAHARLSEAPPPPAGAQYRRAALEATLSCPRCRAETLESGTVGHLSLWRCTTCSGFWLDSDTLGEISKSTARRTGETVGAMGLDLILEGAFHLLAGIFEGF